MHDLRKLNVDTAGEESNTWSSYSHPAFLEVPPHPLSQANVLNCRPGCEQHFTRSRLSCLLGKHPVSRIWTIDHQWHPRGVAMMLYTETIAPPSFSSHPRQIEVKITRRAGAD